SVQMREGAVYMIGQERATRTSFLPFGTEHKVINDQLAPSVEKLGECRLPFRPVENVVLLDLDPGQLAPLPAEFIAPPRELFSFCQEGATRPDPFLPRYNLLVPK